MDQGIIEKFGQALLAGLGVVLVAVLHLLVALSLPISDEVEKAATNLLDAMGGVVILVLVFRARTNNKRVVAKRNHRGVVVAGDASPVTTGQPLPVAPDPVTGKPVVLMKLAPPKR